MTTALNILRPPTTAVCTIEIDEKAVFQKKLQAEWYITAEYISTTVLAVQLGDYIVWNSENYFINRLPDVEKLNNNTYKYSFVFDSVLSDLNKKLFMWEGLADFDLNGTAEDFIDLLITNINSISTGWTKGTVTETDEVTMQFANESCRAVLIRVAEQFKMEFDVVAKAISLSKTIGTTTALTFTYGRGLGLYNLTRQQVQDQSIITRVYGFGGTKNIPEDYRLRAKRLVFDAIITGTINPTASTSVTGVGTLFETEVAVGDKLIVSGETREIATIVSDTSLTVTEAFTDVGEDTSPKVNHRYLHKNTDVYGIIEGQFTDDTIYPQRTSTLTAANIVFAVAEPYAFDEKESYVEDSALNFNLNDYILDGLTRKIVFKTGDLAGIECDIWKYTEIVIDEVTHKRIYFNPYSDADGYTLPKWLDADSQLKPREGDSYTLVDMKMPQTYVDTAEAALQTATQAFLEENCVPMVVYSCALDPQYVKTIAAPTVGDKVTIVDTALGIDNLIRVSGIEYPLINPNKITATIADFVPYTLQERIVKGVITEKKETKFVEKRSAELARRNTVRQNQLRGLLFDTDGYFDTDNIKPLSIETMYLAVGTKSSNFWLNGIAIEPNFEGDANAVNISAGELIHLQLNVTGLGYTWVLGSGLLADELDPAKAYYLYAKCSKTALTAEWVLTDAQIAVESVTGYYHLLVGILFSVLDGARDYDFTYGMTYINGRVITTGRIRSIDGLNYFDLDSNQFRMGNANSSLDWNVTAANTLTLKGAMSQSAAGTFPVIVFCGAYDAGVTYSKGNQVTYGGSSWNYINATPGSGHTPAEDAYWTAAANKGQSGLDIIMTNVAMPLQANSAGVVGSYVGSGVSFGVYEGGTRLVVDQTEPYANSTFRVSMIDDTDITAGAQSTSGSPVVWITYADAVDMTADKASITFLVTVKNSAGVESTFTRIQNFSKARAGTNGADGSSGISIIFQGSYASIDALIADKGALQSGWAYYNTASKKSYVYYSPSWYMMSEDGSTGSDGLTAYVHIAWATDAGGTNFNTSWFSGATYMGIYTDHTIADSTDYHDYTWSKNVGTDGAAGARGPAVTYRGIYSGAATYYGAAARVDVVKYDAGGGYTYYAALPTIGGAFNHVPTDTGYWTAFGASFESIATGLLFAEKAVVENLAVRYYEGIAIGDGDMNGTASTVVANGNATARIDTIDFTGTIGKSDVTCENITREISFDSTWGLTLDNFINNYYSDYYAANVIISRSGSSLFFTARTAGIDFTYNDTSYFTTSGDIDGTVNSPYQSNSAGTARIDKIVLTDGTAGGYSNITCSNKTTQIAYNTSGATEAIRLEKTAADFVASNAAAYLAGGAYSTSIIVTSSGAEIYFTAAIAGQDFTSAASISTSPVNPYRGNIVIEGNDIWENTLDNDTTGTVCINRRGYDGGMTHYRKCYVFDGRGHLMFRVEGSATNGAVSVDANAFTLNGSMFNAANIPTSSSGLSTGQIYRDGASANATLKMV